MTRRSPVRVGSDGARKEGCAHVTMHPIKTHSITRRRYAETPFSRADLCRIDRRIEQRCWLGTAFACALVGALMLLTQQVIVWRGLP